MKTRTKVFLILGLLFLFADASRAQTRFLKGIVLDETTNEPLAFATVFFNTTTKGTNTDQDGKFRIEVDPRFDELVISYLGYHPLSYKVSTDKLDAQYTFRLVPQAQQIEEVEITAKRDRNWYTNLAIFKREFIGRSTFSEKVELENPEVLYFVTDKNSAGIEAKARGPLILQNKALGYKVEYTLEQFHYDESRQRVFILGYPRFELLSGNNRKEKRWQRNRKRAYYGSTTHFLKTLYSQRLEEEGYQVRKLFRDSLPDHLIDAGHSNENQNRISNILTKANVSKVQYLDKNLHDYKTEIKRIGDSLYLSFPEYWQVVYTREREDFGYVNVGEYRTDRGTADRQTSVMSLTKEGIYINEYGLPDDPLALFFEGYWAFEKMGVLLPLDYEPGQ